MPPSAIREEFEKRAQHFRSGLVGLVPDYLSLPDGPRLALFDMAWNLGLNGLSKFRKLISACNDKNWDVAAVECHRSSSRAARNEDTASLFLSAVAS